MGRSAKSKPVGVNRRAVSLVVGISERVAREPLDKRQAAPFSIERASARLLSLLRHGLSAVEHQIASSRAGSTDRTLSAGLLLTGS
jgi:hypothetical protein